MITLDFSQCASLWYIGGMISGFLLCLAGSTIGQSSKEVRQ